MERLRKFYKSVFPFDRVAAFLRLNERREFAFTNLDGIMTRYATFDGIGSFSEKVVSDCPVRVDVGAIYEDVPVKGGSNVFWGRELVFDVDLTDYDRSCGCTKSVCDNCFFLINSAMGLLDYVLRDEFGMMNVNFFFSGRRGLHCWVTDEDVLRLSGYERSAIVDYINAVPTKKRFPGVYTDILRKYVNENDVEKLYDRAYVRLDREVTTNMSHLIKMPFCIHPGSGLVCVALDPSERISVKDIPSSSEAIENPAVVERFIRNFRFSYN